MRPNLLGRLLLVLLFLQGLAAETDLVRSVQDEPVLLDIFVAPEATSCTTLPQCGNTSDCPCPSFSSALTSIHTLIENGNFSVSRGDWATLRVLPGTYVSNTGNAQLDFQGLPISIISTEGSEKTVMSCAGLLTTYFFNFPQSNFAKSSIINGLTFTNCQSFLSYVMQFNHTSAEISDVLILKMVAQESISFISSSGRLENMAFSQSTFSGSLLNIDASTVYINNVTFTSNVGATTGQLISISNKFSVFMDKSMIVNNTVKGVMISASGPKDGSSVIKSSLHVSNTKFNMNTAEFYQWNFQATAFSFDNCYFSQNKQTYVVIHTTDCSYNITNSQFLASVGQLGSVIMSVQSVLPYQRASISGCSFDSSQVTVSGPALYFDSILLSFTQNEIGQTYANGPAFSYVFSETIENSVVLYIFDCTFKSNSGKSTASSLSINTDSMAIVNNCTFKNDIIIPTVNIAGGEGLIKFQRVMFSTSIGAIQTLGNLAITDSVFSKGYGNPFTGIYFRGGTLLIDRCLFSESYGSSYGAILGDSSYPQNSITIKNSTFDNNFTLNIGAAIYLSGSVSATITDSIFTNNNSTRIGGVIAMDKDSVLNMNNCNFTGNGAQYGGILALQGRAFANLTYCNARGNNATYGGCVYSSEDSTVWINRMNASYNFAQEGGALYFSGNSNSNVNYSLFHRNTVISGGGAMKVSDQVSGKISFTTFTMNTALLGGAMVFTDYAHSELHQCEIFLNNASSSGGAVAIQGYSYPTFNLCFINNNNASSLGGGAVIANFAKPRFYLSEIKHNFSPNEGGGMHIGDQTDVWVAGCIFSGNVAGASGGALSFSILAMGTIVDSIIFFNIAKSKGGGAVFSNNCAPRFVNSIFVNNYGTSGGGVWLTDTSRPHFLNTNFTENNAISRGGGALCSDYSKGYFENCIFFTNVATAGPGGGAVVMDFSNTTFTGTTFAFNEAQNGGGLYGSADFSPNVNNSNFFNNTGGLSGGGITLAESSSATITHCTITGNNAENGAGVFVQDISQPRLQHLLITENTAKSSGGGAYFADRSMPYLYDIQITNNVGYRGGGIYIQETVNGSFIELTIKENTGQTGGGIYTLSYDSQFIRSNITKNTATSGGALTIEAQAGSPLIPLFIDCDFSFNNANEGGAIYILSTAIAGSEYDLKPTSQHKASGSKAKKDEGGDVLELAFVNASITNNTANRGAGLFYSSSQPVIGFGPGILFVNNTAGYYGGAIFVDDPLSDSKSAWIIEGFFEGNEAGFGGSTVAWDGTPKNNATFCQACTFGNANVSPYQTSQGFSTLPTSLVLTGCSDQTLTNSTFFVVNMMIDGFGTVVKGKVLEAESFVSTLSEPTEAGCHLYATVFEVNFDTETGQANFTGLSLTGKQNLACEFVFTTNNSISAEQPLSNTCGITLTGCPNGLAIKSEDGIDMCERVFWTVNRILLLVIIILFAIILFILALTGTYHIRRRIKKRAAMDSYSLIPDLQERPNVSLVDILNDSSIPQIPWDDLTVGDRIGIGASGLVLSGVWSKKSNGKEVENRDVAIKELLFEVADSLTDSMLNNFLVEIKLMSALTHPKIVEFIGITLPSPHKLCLVTELMHQGSLRDVLDRKGKNLPWKLRFKLAKDAAKGMAYLHARKVIHRDLKPQNLLVTKDWVCKVADFGISTIKPEITRTMTCIGTPIYMAPEVLMKNKYSEKADVYSMGVVLVEIFTGVYPYSDGKYQHMNQAQLMMQICQFNARPNTDDLPIALQQLVYDCWHENPSLRPNFSEIITRLRRLQGVEFPSTLVSGTSSSLSTSVSSSTMSSSFARTSTAGGMTGGSSENNYSDEGMSSSLISTGWSTGSFTRGMSINTTEPDMVRVRDRRHLTGEMSESPFPRIPAHEDPPIELQTIDEDSFTKFNEP